MEEKNYSDIEVLFGKSVITTEEIYNAMMNTEEECSALGNEIWAKENPKFSGMSLKHIKKHPVTQEDRDKLNDLESKLWHICHQLIHNCIIDYGNKIDGNIYTYTINIYNESFIFTTNTTEGLVWIKKNNNEELNDDEYTPFELFSIAQDIYFS